MQDEASGLRLDDHTADHARLILGESILFRGLSLEDKKALFARVSVGNYAAGSTIFLRGSPGDSIMAVLTGSVRISVPTTDGHPLVLALMSPGDIFGEIAVLDGKERTTDAIAVTDCSLATLARSDILSFLYSHPTAWTNIVGILCERLRKLNEHVSDLGLPQLFLVLDPAEIERVRRFAEPRHYAPGEALFRTGESGHGLFVVLAGKVDLIRQDEMGDRKRYLSFGPGGVIGEMAQLAGRPVLVDGFAQGPVDVLAIPPDRLRALLIAEAELGERVMDALILRRVGGSSAVPRAATCFGSRASSPATATLTNS
jgi:CRP-like cAMP-binding protein